MNQFNEDNLVEQTVIKIIEEIWADSTCHINAYKEDDDLALGRENQGEVVLKKYLLPALKKINSSLPEEALIQAIDLITRDRSNLSLVKANKEVYKLLRDGVNVIIEQPNGETKDERVRFFDFEDINNNHFFN